MAKGFDDVVDEVDVDVKHRLKSFTLNMKQQADQLITSSKFEDAIRLYRELLMHLTKSQVNMIVQKDMVLSCRMNILAAMCKIDQWRNIPKECGLVLQFIEELETVQDNQTSDGENTSVDVQIVGRVHYFRGLSYFRMSNLKAADADLRKAMQLLPNLDSIREHWKEVQAAMKLESKVKKQLAIAMNHYQAKAYSLAVQTCKEALKECKQLRSNEMAGIVHGNAAASLVKMGKDTEAIDNYKAAIGFGRMVASGINPERIWDLMEGLTACYTRQNDYEAASMVLKQAIALFPHCKNRQDREHTFFLSAGRVQMAREEYEEAETYLIRSEKAAKLLKDTGTTLHAMVGLAQMYVAQTEWDKLSKLLDRAIPLTQREKDDAMYSRFLLFWLTSMENEAEMKRKLPEMDEARIFTVCKYFMQKRHREGHLRSAHVLAMIWRDRPMGSLEQQQLTEVLSSLDAVRDDNLPVFAAELLKKLVLFRVDDLVLLGEISKARKVLMHTLTAVKAQEPTMSVRTALLHRFAAVSIMDRKEEMDVEAGSEEFLDALLQEAIALLRKDCQTDENKSLLSSMLARMAQAEAHNQANADHIKRAEALLKECVGLLRSGQAQGALRSKMSEQLCESLLGLCVLQLKQRNLSRAQSLMAEIETFSCARVWMQLHYIKDQLCQLEEAKKAKDKKKITISTQTTPNGMEDLLYHPSIIRFAQWWDEWWFTFCVILVGVAFGWAMGQ